MSLEPGAAKMFHNPGGGSASGPAWSALSRDFAASSDDAGFCPVISRPSTTTWDCQSLALE
jgi:hypothetical protein